MWARFTEFAARFLTEEAARVYILPIAATIGLGVIGWLQDIPWFYLCVGVVGVGLLFGSVSTGLLRFDEWRYRKRVADKLTFNSVRVSKSLDDTGGVKSIRLGFKVNSTAMFSIQFKVTKLNTQFGKFYPPKKEYKVKEFTVPPHGIAFFDDYNIEIQGQSDGVFEGQIKCRLEYGKPGRLDNVLDINKKVFFQFNDKGDIEKSRWIDQ